MVALGPRAVFGDPELVRGLVTKQMTVMTVPEAAVHQNDGVPLRKYEVRFAWKGLHPDAITKSSGKESSRDNLFGARAGGSNGGHEFGPLLRCKHVSHVEPFHVA